MNSENPPLKSSKCPYCGGTLGYYQRLFIYGWVERNFDFNHRPDHKRLLDDKNDGIHMRDDKIKYCRDYDKPIVGI